MLARAPRGTRGGPTPNPRHRRARQRAGGGASCHASALLRLRKVLGAGHLRAGAWFVIVVVTGIAVRLAVAALLLAPMPAVARTDPDAEALSGLCLDAARSAAVRHGIPPRMMLAITLVETGRRLGGAAAPWPWTLNVEGKGYWHPNRADARAHAEREIAAGRRSVDLGCFQLNYRWHGAAFASPDAMLDPEAAANYAARFLAGLHAETGDWMRAAGLYHSRSPALAERYRGRIDLALARFGHLGIGAVTLAPEPEPRPDPKPGPRRVPAEPRWAGAIRLAALDRRRGEARDPLADAAPGAVALRLFPGQARALAGAGRPLLAAKP